MKHRAIAFLGCAILCGLAIGQTKPDSDKSAKLQVHLEYTGAGTVDSTHKIYIVLWDSPDFVKGSAGQAPFAVQYIASKKGTATFSDIRKNPVYVSIAYDPTGKWEARSEPPVGASLGLYSKEPGVPAPVQLEPGKTTEISVKLDDSFKKQKMETRPQ